MSCFVVALGRSQAELGPRLALLSRKGMVSETSNPWTNGRSSIQQRKGTWFPTAFNRMTQSHKEEGHLGPAPVVRTETMSPSLGDLMSHNHFLQEHLMDVRHTFKEGSPCQQKEDFRLVPGPTVRPQKGQRTLHLIRVLPLHRFLPLPLGLVNQRLLWPDEETSPLPQHFQEIGVLSVKG